MTLERACERLLSLQDESGWWKGELQTNVTMDAEDMLLREFLGIRRSGETERSAAWIRSQQRPDGTWANFYGGPGELSTTIEAYWALRLGGRRGPSRSTCSPRPASSASMEASSGDGSSPTCGLPCSGCGRGSRSRRLPPEIVLLPSWVALNVYDFACWARQTIVALSVVMAHRPQRPLPFALEELHGSEPWRPAAPASARGRWLVRLDRVLRAYERHPVRTVAQAGTGSRRALDRASPGGGWLVGWDPAALGVLPDGAPPERLPARASGDAARHRGSGGVHGREPTGAPNWRPHPSHVPPPVAPAGPSRRLEACQSPVWDTALAVVALSDAGVPRGPSFARARRGVAARRGGAPLRGLARGPPRRAARGVGV